jgi:hypothetical protein
VHPERAPISFSGIASQIQGLDGKAIAGIKLNIFQNQITVAVESEEKDIFTLRNWIKSEVEFVTNIAGFLMGYGYDVEITKSHTEDLSMTQVFGIDIPVLAERAQMRDFNNSINSIFPLCYGVEAIFLRRALADLSSAIKHADDTAFYCFRAIESLRQSFGADLPDADQWKAMSEAVGSSKEEMEPLRSHAFPARHGIPKPLTDKDRQQFFLYTWNIVEKYIDFRLKKAGSEPVFNNT